MRSVRSLLVVLAVLSLVLSACGQATVPSPEATTATPSSLAPSTAPSAATPSSAPPSETPTASPAATPSTTSPPAAKLTVGKIATVVTNDLRVRSKPSVSNDSTKFEPLLDKGRLVFVVKGPVKGSGYQWYEVEPLRRTDQEDGALPFGWVASAGKDGEPWVTSGTFKCPKAPTTYNAFTDLSPLVGVACFGRKPLTFAARLERPEATCGIDPGWTIEPDWLGSTCPQPKFLIASPKTTDSFSSVLAPGFNASGLHPGVDVPDWIDVKVTGHFDDKAAKTCKAVSTDGSTKPDLGHDAVITSCRAQFVITKIKKTS